MNQPKCLPFPPAARFKRTEIQSIEFDGDLVIRIQAVGPSTLRVIFHNPVWFRVLDERDLCEFWDNYHEGNGWLYEVEQGGWLELEKKRPLFNSHVVVKGLREYLLVDDQCVSILTVEHPEIISD
ncbi:MAG TPA: hypothetical protein VGN12_06775 [Pirellulales bacterium]|jgi:hypothetical protein